MSTKVDLRLGDCLEILPTLADKSVDAIITDIPYGTTACSWDVVIPFEPMWEQVKRLCKGAFVTTAGQPFASILTVSNLEWFKYEWIWSKNFGGNPATLKYQPNKTHDNVFVFSKNGHTYNPQKQRTDSAEALRRSRSKGKSNTIRRKGTKSNHVGMEFTEGKFSEFVNPRTVQYFEGVPKQHLEHPTQKPVALYEYLIKTYTNPGDTVLDFCMGSGTTGVACVKTGRNFIGIEKEAKYFAIAEKRIAEAQQQMIMEFA
jgi:site-specific DNA-methyltransferase (adenine-specific)